MNLTFASDGVRDNSAMNNKSQRVQYCSNPLIYADEEIKADFKLITHVQQEALQSPCYDPE